MIKKMFIALILSIITIASAMASDKYYIATHYTIKASGKEFSDWKQTEIAVVLDTTRKRIVIASNKEQIIDYTMFVKTEDSRSIRLTSAATDSHYQSIMITFITTINDSLYLLIEYDDYQYMYSLVDVSDQYE